MDKGCNAEFDAQRTSSYGSHRGISREMGIKSRDKHTGRGRGHPEALLKAPEVWRGPQLSLTGVPKARGAFPLLLLVHSSLSCAAQCPGH